MNGVGVVCILFSPPQNRILPVYECADEFAVVDKMNCREEYKIPFFDRNYAISDSQILARSFQ